MDNSSVTSTATRFEIVTWDGFLNQWTAEGLGDQDGNVFNSEHEAEEAIATLRNAGGDHWRTARYGVREIDAADVDEAGIRIEMAWTGFPQENPGWLVSVEGGSWQPGPDCAADEPGLEDAMAAVDELLREYPAATIVWNGREL